MANEYGISEAELQLAKTQAARRMEMRREFLKQRTNPWVHTAESGYVFDPAVQKFMSMKATQFEHFKPNKSTTLFGIFTILPMFAYGYLIWKDRAGREAQIRSGELKYRDRMFKLQ